MSQLLVWTVAASSCVCLCGQTAEELVAKNLQARGGIEKIKSIKSYRLRATYQQGTLSAGFGQDAVAPNLLRQSFTLQGMTQTQAYDGSTGWQISPFQGRKDPELLGEDDLRDLVETADFYGPLVDYREKGNSVEYMGHDTVDGDDAYRLKVTLKNGDIIYYFLDPDTYLEIRTETTQFIRGSVKESFSEFGAYKQVAGVYYPFSIESGRKQNPGDRNRVMVEKIEPNVELAPAEFKMPPPPAGSSTQAHSEAPSGPKPPR